MTDSGWLVRVESDNARISSRISASRSGGSGDMLICYRRHRLKIVSAVTFFSWLERTAKDVAYR